MQLISRKKPPLLFYAIGSGLGAIESTLSHAYAGWLGVGALGTVTRWLALVFWGLRGPNQQ